MVNIKSQEEVLVIIQKAEECTSLEELGKIFEESLPHPRILRAVFLRRIKQLDRNSLSPAE